VGSVIAGVSRPDQVLRNVSAASWRPTRSDLEELATINRDALPGMSHRTYALRH
jgi:aryl-alcohol dehydrogenase-like predicted oxidoreductase